MTEPRTPPPRLQIVESIDLGVRLDPYLSLTALATYASVSRRWLEERLRNSVDALPSFRFGRRRVVKQSEFDAWAARRRMREQADVGALTDEILRDLRVPRRKRLTPREGSVSSSEISRRRTS